MKKRMATALLALAMLGTAAHAADSVQITRVQENMPTDTTGAMRTLMHADFADGQELYFLCGDADFFDYRMEDVDFDGDADFVTFPVHGARNIYAEFYLFEDGEYVYAPVWNGRLCNFELDAAQKRVYSAEFDGYRDRQEWVFAWKDGHLEPLRSLSVHAAEAFVSTETGYTITHDYDSYEIVVRDYTQNVNGDVIFRETYPADETGALDAQRIGAAETLLRE